MFLAASLLTGIAAGAAVGGWGLLAGLVLAGILAAVTPVQSMRPELRASVLLWLGVLAARGFAAYLVPEHQELSAAAVVALATGAAALGGHLSTYGRGLLAGGLLLAGASFAAICFGVEPPPKPAGDGGIGFFGVLAAAGLFLAPLAVLEPDVPRPRVLIRVGVGAGVAVAVAAGALYQLGPDRLGLSDAPLRDALAAADAATLGTMLSVAVVVVTLPAVLAAIARASAAMAGPTQGSARLRTVAVGGVCTLAAALVPATIALIVASSVVVAGTALSWVQKRVPRTS